VNGLFARSVGSLKIDLGKREKRPIFLPVAHVWRRVFKTAEIGRLCGDKRCIHNGLRVPNDLGTPLGQPGTLVYWKTRKRNIFYELGFRKKNAVPAVNAKRMLRKAFPAS
jgi:hypothetical protein